MSAPRLSATASKVSGSASMAVSRRARELRRTGVEVIDLSVGEPDFPTPSHIRQAGIDAIRNGATRYDSVAGLHALREAICEKLKRDNDLEYSEDQITVGCGSKQVIYNALAATIDAGDEVLVPAPYWTSYPDMITLSGGVPVVIRTSQDSGFKLQSTDLEQAITGKTRWLIINSPANPTGAVYSRADLERLADVLEGHPDVGVISDDIYEHVIFEGVQFCNVLSVAPDLYERTVVTNGLSKAYAMTGWRVGYGAGPKTLVSAMNSVQSHTTTHTCTISQAAAIAALSGDQGAVAQYANAYCRRGRYLVSRINAIDGLSCLPPAGAFYCFVNCARLIGRKHHGKALDSDVDVATCFLETGRVAVVPGAAYGASPYLRISFAAEESVIDEAVARIKATIEELE